jgi:hypothetical protein
MREGDSVENWVFEHYRKAFECYRSVFEHYY